jgi:hypothetical protein
MLERILPPETKLLVRTMPPRPQDLTRGIKVVFLVTIVWPDGECEYLPEIGAKAPYMSDYTINKIRKWAKIFKAMRLERLEANNA